MIASRTAAVGFWARMRSDWLTRVTEKETGLEGWSLEEVLQAANHLRAFNQSWHEVLQTHSWAHLLNLSFLRSGKARRFRNLLREKLSVAPLLELGVGERFERHRTIFKGFFGVREYFGIERRSVRTHKNLFDGDLLERLSEQPSHSRNIAAFGVFNEPLDAADFFRSNPERRRITAAHVEHEYLRRLARELKRVVPIGGIVFGDGLRPLSGGKDDLENYLHRSGFAYHAPLQREIRRALLRTPQAWGIARFPFFLERIA